MSLAILRRLGLGGVAPLWNPATGFVDSPQQSFSATASAESATEKDGRLHGDVVDVRTPCEEDAAQGKKRKLTPLEVRLYRTAEYMVHKLRLKNIITSGYKNNCLAFSCMIGSGKIGVTPREQKDAAKLVERERELTHLALIAALPTDARKSLGGFDLFGDPTWWTCYSQKRSSAVAVLEYIFANNLFMREPHLYAFATRLNRDIIVIDGVFNTGRIVRYKPGYEMATEISLTLAIEIREETCARDRPLWVMLTPNHFSALLPIT